MIRKSFSKLVEHLRTHISDRPFACIHPKCKLFFTQKANMKAHLSTHYERS